MSGLVEFHDRGAVPDRFLQDVLQGLTGTPKTLLPKYLYDEVGSALFEAICALDAYYPTRTELGMMESHASDMAAHMGADAALIEFGSGASRKSRLLIAASRPRVYVPIDISREMLRASAEQLQRSFPALSIVAVCADYSDAFALPPLDRFGASRRIMYFPGSTIGNLDPLQALAFLRQLAGLAGEGGGLLIGVDLRKDSATLVAAYDDPQGVTAAFNLNVLARINRQLDADFDLRAFRHVARYDAELGRIEMHLESLREQTVRIGTTTIAFARGETIHTENSYKYTVDGFQALAASAGFQARECWTDTGNLFSIHYMTC
jgi:dimethylhistidine N-methyltransferase